MKHNTCNHIYQVRPSAFLKGTRCPKCAGNIKKTTKEFKEEVYNKVKDEYEVLGEYINANTPIEIKHNNCGLIYKVKSTHFLSGSRCPKCAGKMKKTTGLFKEEVCSEVKNEYEVLGEYINADTPIEMKHNACNHIYQVRPSAFLKGARCPKCAGNIKKTTKEFKEEVYNKVKDEYKVLGEYVNTNTHIEMIHKICGHVYSVIPANFLKGTRCPKCYGNTKKTTEQFKEEVYSKVKDEYEVLGEYTNNATPVEMKHNKCGHIYLVSPASFLSNGTRCPKCNSSKGELAIIEFLNKYNINYKHDKPYGGCSYRNPLRFDFLIFDDEENLKLIVEFDGEFHFMSVDALGGEAEFQRGQIRDKIKNKFCKENDIPLLRIPYWEFDNIHKILGKKLYKLGLI